MGSTFKGKHLLSGSRLFPLRMDPSEKGGKYIRVRLISFEKMGSIFRDMVRKFHVAGHE